MTFSTLVLLAGLTMLSPKAAGAFDSPQALAAQAVKINPEISMLKHQVEALKQQERAAAIWKDPVFMVEYSNMPWSEPYPGEHAMSGVQFKVQQTFPFPGKNDKRLAAAAAKVHVRRLELEELKNKLNAMVKQSYWKLALVRGRRAIRVKHVRIVGRLLEAVTAGYATGSGKHQQDIMKLQVLKNKLADDIADFEQMARELTVTINSVLHRDVHIAIETDEKIPLVKNTTPYPVLVERAREGRSLLKAWKKKAELQRLIAAREAYEKWPDITVWTGYRIRHEAGRDQGRDFVSAGISVPIPFDYRKRYDSRRAAFLADALAFEAKYRSIMDSISSDIKNSLLRWQRSYDKAVIYENRLIREARATLEAALSQWQVGKTEFSSLYQAELQLLNFDEIVMIAKAQTILMSIEVQRLIGQSTQSEETS